MTYHEVYTNAPEGTHWPSDEERLAIANGSMPFAHFRTVLRYDEVNMSKAWHPAVYDVAPTGQVTSRTGLDAWPVDAVLAANAELACADCGESPDYMVLSEGGHTHATFKCNDCL